MKRINRMLSRYVVYASPIVLAMFLWGLFQGQSQVLHEGGAVYLAWELLSWHLIAWFVVLIYLLFALLFSTSFRDEVLAKIVRVRERDERESQIAGRSGRFTFFATLALLVFLFFFLTVEITVRKLPPDRAVDGKQRELSIGLSFEVLDRAAAPPDEGIIFSTKSVPVSKQSMLMLIIAWHVGTFLYLSRRLQARE